MTPFALWVYLSASPLFWLSVTLVAWLAADRVADLAGRNPLVNPVFLAIIVIAIMLRLTGTDYGVYFDGAQFVHFLLGPATVALAIPLYRNRERIWRNLLPMTLALGIGSTVAIVSVVLIAAIGGAPHDVVVSLAPKSVTAPVAMAVSENLGGIPALTAALVIATGVLGAIIAIPMMNALGVRDHAARGFAMGLASHGIGTARAFNEHAVMGAFAGVGMALNAVLTSILAPILLHMLF